jgi:hypothetical protein
MNFQKLCAPFPPSAIHWRVGNVFSKDGLESTAMVLAYLDARDVMDRLDEVAGPGNWQCRYSHADKKTICDIGIRIDGDWVWKADGAGDTDIEADKGALSDAFKRAAVRWGIGRYLYGLGDTKAKVTRKSNTSKYWIIGDSEIARLQRMLPSPSRPVAAASGGSTPLSVEGGGSPPPPPSAPIAELPKKIDSPETLAQLTDLFRNAQSQLQLKALGLKYRQDIGELEAIAPEEVQAVRDVYTKRMEELA